VTAFVVAAVAMIVSLVPAGIVIVRGTLADAVVGFEFVTAVVVLVFALLAEGFERPGLFEFPVLVAVLAFGSGLVYVRALERWLEGGRDT
jgi:multisubunit Na+/H+ antiporter MnhF subunit